MVKYQKCPYNLGRTKQSGAQPNPSYSTDNLSLEKITPLTNPPPPLTTPEANALKKTIIGWI